MIYFKTYGAYLAFGTADLSATFSGCLATIFKRTVCLFTTTIIYNLQADGSVVAVEP